MRYTLEEKWKWETLCNKGIEIFRNNNSINQILSLQATPGKEIKIGYRIINGSTHGNLTEIGIYYTNFSKPRDNEKS